MGPFHHIGFESSPIASIDAVLMARKGRYKTLPPVPVPITRPPGDRQRTALDEHSATYGSSRGRHDAHDVADLNAHTEKRSGASARPACSPPPGDGWYPTVKSGAHDSRSTDAGAKDDASAIVRHDSQLRVASYGFTRLKVPPKAVMPFPFPAVPVVDGAVVTTNGCSWLYT